MMIASRRDTAGGSATPSAIQKHRGAAGKSAAAGRAKVTTRIAATAVGPNETTTIIVTPTVAGTATRKVIRRLPSADGKVAADHHVRLPAMMKTTGVPDAVAKTKAARMAAGSAIRGVMPKRPAAAGKIAIGIDRDTVDKGGPVLFGASAIFYELGHSWGSTRIASSWSAVNFVGVHLEPD
jgi:hypothetical protein